MSLIRGYCYKPTNYAENSVKLIIFPFNSSSCSFISIYIFISVLPYVKRIHRIHWNCGCTDDCLEVITLNELPVLQFYS